MLRVPSRWSSFFNVLVAALYPCLLFSIAVVLLVCRLVPVASEPALTCKVLPHDGRVCEVGNCICQACGGPW